MEKNTHTEGEPQVRCEELLSGVELIAAERKRQVSEEMWTPEHGDCHDQRELARAAEGYLTHYTGRAWVYTNELGAAGITDGPAAYQGEPAPDAWPWCESYWNPKTPLRDLVKAGALIAAEIDRLMRVNRNCKACAGEVDNHSQFCPLHDAQPDNGELTP